MLGTNVSNSYNMWNDIFTSSVHREGRKGRSIKAGRSVGTIGSAVADSRKLGTSRQQAAVEDDR